jgi:hypothetical protein
MNTDSTNIDPVFSVESNERYNRLLELHNQILKEIQPILTIKRILDAYLSCGNEKGLYE